MNHSTGISDSYYRATEGELLEDYLKALDMLSVNDDKLTLQKQVAELTEKSKEENYIIKGKLSEKEQEIQLLNQGDSMNADAIATLSDFNEDAIKWKTDPYSSEVAKDGFQWIKKSITKAEYILEEIDRSFSVQNYWKAIRLNASQLEWLQYFFLYERDALMRGMDPRSKSEKKPETEWKCDCAIIDHLLKNIESKRYFHDLLQLGTEKLTPEQEAEIVVAKVKQELRGLILAVNSSSLFLT
ncbi:MAG: hypothetical protein WBF33_07330 [Candidatus Nitrosopolaris sp.]